MCLSLEEQCLDLLALGFPHATCVSYGTSVANDSESRVGLEIQQLEIHLARAEQRCGLQGSGAVLRGRGLQGWR